MLLRLFIRSDHGYAFRGSTYLAPGEVAPSCGRSEVGPVISPDESRRLDCGRQPQKMPGSTSSDRSANTCSCSAEYRFQLSVFQISTLFIAPMTTHSRSSPA